MRTQYLRKSREEGIIQRAATSMNRIIDRTAAENPLALGEQRIDPRTARKRLGMIPPDQLYDHYNSQG